MVVVRKAETADAEAIHRAHMQSIQEVCSQDHSREEIAAWGGRPFNRAKWTSAIENDEVWVTELEGIVEGYAHLRSVTKANGIEAQVQGLYLTQKALGKGTGKKLLEMMLATAQTKGAKRVSLESTLTAHAFYQKMGFQDEGPQIQVEIAGQKVRCYPMALQFK